MYNTEQCRNHIKSVVNLRDEVIKLLSNDYYVPSGFSSGGHGGDFYGYELLKTCLFDKDLDSLTKKDIVLVLEEFISRSHLFNIQNNHKDHLNTLANALRCYCYADKYANIDLIGDLCKEYMNAPEWLMQIKYHLIDAMASLCEELKSDLSDLPLWKIFLNDRSYAALALMSLARTRNYSYESLNKDIQFCKDKGYDFHFEFIEKRINKIRLGMSEF